MTSSKGSPASECRRSVSPAIGREWNPLILHKIRPSSDTEFASNLRKCVVTRSGFCRWRRVAEYEKQRRLLSLN
jgi:hypothetical protein